MQISGSKDQPLPTAWDDYVSQDAKKQTLHFYSIKMNTELQLSECISEAIQHLEELNNRATGTNTSDWMFKLLNGL